MYGMEMALNGMKDNSQELVPIPNTSVVKHHLIMFFIHWFPSEFFATIPQSA